MSANDTTLGFRWRGTRSGAPMTYQTFTFKDTETLHYGDIANVESSEVDLGATNDTGFVGMVLETKAGVDSTTQIKVTTNIDAIFGVYDPNARAIGDLLDLSGATGAQTVTTASNNDFVVIASSSATEETLVCFAPGENVTNIT